MLRRHTLALAFAALPLAAAAQEQTPGQFLSSIYDPYKKSDFKGQPYWEVERFFSPDLARATIVSIEVLGALRASAAVKAALTGRIR